MKRKRRWHVKVKKKLYKVYYSLYKSILGLQLLRLDLALYPEEGSRLPKRWLDSFEQRRFYSLYYKNGSFWRNCPKMFFARFHIFNNLFFNFHVPPS